MTDLPPRLLGALSLVLAAVPHGLAAQPLPPLDEYHVRVYGPAEGVRYVNVRGLAQTADGNLYVAGGRGIARFGDRGFTEVPMPGARSGIVEYMYRDSQDRLWVLSTGNDPLGYHARGRFHSLPKPPVPIDRFMSTVDGRIWLGGGHGLVHFDGDRPYTVYTEADGLPSDSVLGVHDTPTGHIVVVTNRQLARVEPDTTRPGRLRFTRFGPEVPIIAVTAMDRTGLWLVVRDEESRNLLMHTDGRRVTEPASRDVPAVPAEMFHLHDPTGGSWGLVRARPVLLPGDTTRSGDPVARVVSGVLRAVSGPVWFVLRSPDGDDVLVRHDGMRLDTIPLQDHLEFSAIQHLLEDHEGSLWIGTDRGLLQLVRRRVFAVTREDGLADGFTVPVLQTRDGALWVGTWGGGLHRFADGRLTHLLTTEHGLPHNTIRSLFESSDGSLWVGTGAGYARLLNATIMSSVQSFQVRSFAETPDQHGGRPTLWIGTLNDLLHSTPDGGFTRHRPGFWSEKKIWALHTARDGSLWIGSERGLFRLAGDSLHTFTAADGLRSSFVVSIREEDDGTLWFGTYNHGLHRYRNGRFTAVTTEEGLLHDGIWRMLADDRSGIWMSSDGGIFRVDSARLHDVADALERGDRPRPLLPLIFTETEGTPSRESNRASPGGWRLDDGRLVFNNIAGLVVIDPARALESRPPPRTVLHAAEYDGQQLVLSGTRPPRVPAGTRQIAFEFAALSFIAPEQNQYRYRLDGYDRDWVIAGTDRHARYTNLPAGRYTFRAQGTTAGTPWAGEEATLAFTVAPHIWQKWWFRLSAITAVVALVTLVYRYRVAQLMEVQRLRLRIAADLHDDVGSNLSSIALLSEMLQADVRPGGSEQKQLRRINQAAEETIGALRDIIWLVGPGHGDSGDLVRRMRDVAADLLNGTAWRFDSAISHAGPLSMSFMRNTLLIYKEALHNIVRHAAAGEVAIRIAADRGDLLLIIEDDGIGFDESDVRAGHGLANMRRRARQMGGNIEITRSPAGGTRVTLSARMAHSRDGHHVGSAAE